MIIGVTADGTKEWVAISDGLRESTESWLDVLRDLKDRGLQAGPRLVVGDGARGFWSALEQVDPDTVHQRCWFHKMGNTLAATRREANQALKRFISRDGAKDPKATEKLEKDREALLAFLAFPADHRVHLRTNNPIESTFATVRHRTSRTKNCVTRTTFLGLAFKLAEEAAKTWRPLRAPEKVAELLGGARYDDGVPVPDDPPETQEEQREAA